MGAFLSGQGGATHDFATMKLLILAAVAVLAVQGRTLDDQKWKPFTGVDPSQYKVRMPKMAVKAGAPTPAGRIVGGEEAMPHSWPEQAALFIDGTYFCGGSLISSTKVLTAAHCTDGAYSVRVVLGAHHPYNDPDAIEITSRDLVVHEGWDGNDIGGGNDVSVITLPEPVSTNSIIQTISLASSEPSIGSTCTVTGWGLTSDFSFSIADDLHQVDIDIISDTSCRATYGYMSSTIMCTSGSGGVGTCSGDSGGPLHYNGNQVGIVSFGAAAGCELGYPDGFTSVAEYRSWINSHM